MGNHDGQSKRKNHGTIEDYLTQLKEVRSILFLVPFENPLMFDKVQIKTHRSDL